MTNELRTAPVSLEDVGKRAAVSASTVSRAINKPQTVREPIRKRILEAIQELGYTPNAHAMALRRGTVESLGLLLSSNVAAIEDQTIISTILAGLMRAAADEGYCIIPETLHEIAPDKTVTSQVASRRLVSGLFVLGYMPRELVSQVINWKLPVCFLGSYEGAKHLPVVDHDFEAGSLEAVQYLAAMGHRRIGLVVGSMDYLSNQGKKAGYLRAVKDFNLDSNPCLIAAVDSTQQHYTGGYLATQELLAMVTPPTAIHYANDWYAIGGLAAALERGLKVPCDLSIIGCDDSFMARQCTPPLTSIHYDFAAMTRNSAQLLIRQIKNQPISEPRLCLQPKLVRRESCGPI